MSEALDTVCNNLAVAANATTGDRPTLTIN